MKKAKDMQPGEPVRFRIRGQTGPNGAVFWEEFVVQYQANMNVISALMPGPRKRFSCPASDARAGSPIT